MCQISTIWQVAAQFNELRIFLGFCDIVCQQVDAVDGHTARHRTGEPRLLSRPAPRKPCIPVVLGEGESPFYYCDVRVPDPEGGEPPAAAGEHEEEAKDEALRYAAKLEDNCSALGRGQRNQRRRACLSRRSGATPRAAAAHT